MKRTLLCLALAALSVCAFAGTLTIGPLQVVTNYVSTSPLGGWVDAYGDSTFIMWTATVGWPGDFNFKADASSITHRTSNPPYAQKATATIEGYWVVQWTLYWTQNTPNEGTPQTVFCNRWNGNWCNYGMQSDAGPCDAVLSASASVLASPLGGSSAGNRDFPVFSYPYSGGGSAVATGHHSLSFSPTWTLVQTLPDGRKRYRAVTPQYKLSDCSASTSTQAIGGNRSLNRNLSSWAKAQGHDSVLFSIQPMN